MDRPGTTASVDQEIRAGSKVLSVFENPLNTRILRAHVAGPLRFSALQEKIDSSAPTTLRVAVGGLVDAGALAKLPASGSGYGAATTLSPAGEEMLAVADAVANWLERCPTGAIELESEEAKEAVKALAGGWSSRLIRALASGPRTLTELHRLIPDVSYPSLERRVSWMRRIGQIEAVEREGRGTPYGVTDWLRRAIGPLSAAGRCERRHLATESGPITAIEVEASFLLVLPLVPLRSSARGGCMLAVHTGPSGLDEEEFPLSGVTVEVGGGRVTSCTTAVNQEPGTWAVGSPETWLDAVIDAEIADFRLGGADPQLALDLVAGLHYALFGE